MRGSDRKIGAFYRNPDQANADDTTTSGASSRRFGNSNNVARDGYLMGQMHYLPMHPIFFSILVGIFALLVFLIQLGVLRIAYLRLGLNSQAALLLLLASLLGSYLNIPAAEIPQQQILSAREIDYFGMRHRVPVVENWPATIVAINVGGALVPTLVSLYLLARNRLWIEGLVATACVAALCYWLAEPLPGLGIALPIFVPAIVTAVVALLLSRRSAAPLAYVGILAVLIASISSGRDSRPADVPRDTTLGHPS
jgi:uncharacterized membrane protein